MGRGDRLVAICAFCRRSDCDADPCPALDRPHIRRELARERARGELLRQGTPLALLLADERRDVRRMVEWAARQVAL